MKKYIVLLSCLIFFNSNKLNADENLFLIGTSIGCVYFFVSNLLNSLDCQLDTRILDCPVQDANNTILLNDISIKCSKNVNNSAVGLFISGIFFLYMFAKIACKRPARNQLQLAVNNLDQNRNDGNENV